MIRSMLSSCQSGTGDGILHSPILGLHTMIGGEGPLSYAQNSSYQRGAVDVAKPIIEEEIMKNLDIGRLSSNSFWIADFGCSTGRNSFLAMQIITKAIQRKFHSERLISQIPDFYVFFNDQVSNDFNTLFRSLPLERHYQAVGLPGKVDYVGAGQEVYDAYSSQYAKDIQTFLEARAEELVSGGLMTLLIPGVPTKPENSNTSYMNSTDLPLIGSCLIDMAKKGRLTEAKINCFNFPMYFTFPEELKAIIERNSRYNIERMEILEDPGKYAMTSANVRASTYRAGLEGLLTHHFGYEIIEELFDRYRDKLEASPALLLPDNNTSILIFVLLKRKME
ncbi:UNVERIFIED_CONTAM: Loganic acid O-methyltransferase [Sesamum radiatum]|uniref:Loganic acid O-methyltransferase n=1 Tax=Sesamum radiatum TaxID=300843 RepID=A0AAW2VLY6_SESRA